MKIAQCSSLVIFREVGYKLMTERSEDPRPRPGIARLDYVWSRRAMDRIQRLSHYEMGIKCKKKNFGMKT